MECSTAWTPSPARRRSVRQRQRLAAVVAVTFAFVVAGVALLAAVASPPWDTTAATTPDPGPPLATPVHVSDQDDGVADDGDDAGADGDAVAEVAGEVVTEQPAETATSDGDGSTGTDPATSEPGAGDDHRGAQDTDTDDEAALDEAARSSGPGGQGTDVDETDRDGTDDGAADAEPGLSVTQVQQMLREYRFLIGPADGSAGQQTTAAVMAFQRVNGLTVDGVVGPATTAALLEGSAEPTLAGGPADRIEVDLSAQLLHLIEGGQRVVTMHVSSGSGGTYETANGGTARSVTPVGSFTVERRIHGVRNAPLGTLYDPLYFYRGFAIHGSPSVPAYPASHGCIRVSKADASWLIDRIPDGMPVQLYGGTHVFTP